MPVVSQRTDTCSRMPAGRPGYEEGCLELWLSCTGRGLAAVSRQQEPAESSGWLSVMKPHCEAVLVAYLKAACAFEDRN